MSSLIASLMISTNERTQPILSGEIKPDRLHIQAVEGNPSDIFWRQLANAEFDISEMSMSSYMKLIDSGDRTWVGIPIFPYSRNFFHTWFLVRKDANISLPSDLQGKRIGVPEYQITSALWSRGVLQEEFGVKPESIFWYMERTKSFSHGSAMGAIAPEGIHCDHLPEHKGMAQMLLDGELDGIAIYFQQHTLVDRSQIDLHNHPGVQTLFPEPIAEGIRYYRKTSIYPINHCVIVRRSLADRHPWLLADVYDMFIRAKRRSETRGLQKADALVRMGLLSLDAYNTLNTDPLPYGVKENRHIIEKLAQYSHEQRLTSRVITVDEMFHESLLHT